MPPRPTPAPTSSSNKAAAIGSNKKFPATHCRARAAAAGGQPRSGCAPPHRLPPPRCHRDRRQAVPRSRSFPIACGNERDRERSNTFQPAAMAASGEGETTAERVGIPAGVRGRRCRTQHVAELMRGTGRAATRATTANPLPRTHPAQVHLALPLIPLRKLRTCRWWPSSTRRS